jgi:hypothetical protein
MSSLPKNAHKVIRIQRLALAEPWQGALIALSDFPVPEEELAPVRDLLQRLVAALRGERSSLETLLQFTSLHLGDGSQRVSSNGRTWMPAMGLGVWPDREPPTRWTMEELRDLIPGDEVRPLMNILLHLTGSQEAREQARDVMLGLGTMIQFVVPPEVKDLLAYGQALLKPAIKDPSFTAFSFYMPLLEAKSVVQATAAQLDAWSCGASAYIRESQEDKGILIVSRKLHQALHSLGAVESRSEKQEWEIGG